MGNCVSTQDREAVARSQEIDRQIEEDSKKFKKECKILLLGQSLIIFSPSPLYYSPPRPRTSVPLCPRAPIPSSCNQPIIRTSSFSITVPPRPLLLFLIEINTHPDVHLFSQARASRESQLS